MKLNENLFEDYSEPTDLGYQIKERIDDKVNDIFAEFQGNLGIENGDIDPMLSLELEQAEEDLSDVIKKGLWAQLGYYPDEYDESLNEAKERMSEEDLYWKFVHFFDDLGYSGNVASQFSGFKEAFSALKNIVNRLDNYYNESLQESVNEDDAWSYEEIEKSLNDYTNGWKRESGTSRTWYETEKDHCKNILKKHYKYVDVSDGRGSDGEEMSWVVAYSDPKEKGAND